MKHRISPTVDCVYKAISGAEENENLLIDFLNAVLAPQFPISDVEILNPYNEREFYSDKLTIVDVKAKDEKGTAYQIEIQLAVFSYLPERILYTWSDIYQSQLQSGEPFSELRPVISIWMLTENLIPRVRHFIITSNWWIKRSKNDYRIIVPSMFWNWKNRIIPRH